MLACTLLSVLFRRGRAGACLALGMLLAGHSTLAATRLAIFSEDRNLEALLISSLKDCEILSRSELPDAAAEAALAGKTLHVPGADLALILEPAGRETNVRLVSAPTGAAVAGWMAPALPADELARWITLRASPFLTASPKEKSARVSLLGLRFEADSPANRATERQANLKLAAEFQAAGVVVLERWRLGDLVFEKSLAADESPFWTNAELLDGSLREENGRYIAQVRLRNATAPERRVSVEAPSIDGLIKKLASEALDLPAGTTKTGALEAESFLAETRWMLANALPNEAWQAAEAAVALGATGHEPEMLRVKAAAMTAYPDDLRVFNTSYNPRAFSSDELPLRVAAASEAASLVGDYFAKTDSAKPDAFRSFVSLGVQTLYTGFRVLRTAEDTGWAKANPAATAGLRASLQRTIGILKATPLGTTRADFLTYLRQYAGYWNDTPADAIAFYRDILRKDFWPESSYWPESARGMAAGEALRAPLLIGQPQKVGPFSRIGPRLLPAPWEPGTRDAWAAFIEELEKSPEPLHQADALALRWQSTADLPARHAIQARIVDFLAANKDLVTGPFGKAVMREFHRPLRDLNERPELAETWEKLFTLILRAVESPEPIPPSLLSPVPYLFEQETANRTDLAKTLLDALVERGRRPGLSAEESKLLAFHQSQLLRKFPQFRTAEIAVGDVVLKKLWIGDKHIPPELRQRIGFQEEAVVWHKGALWVLDPHKSRLWRIQPESGECEIISPANGDGGYSESALVAWDNRLAMSTKTGVKVLNEDLTAWRELNLPQAQYAIGVAGGSLWAATGQRSGDFDAKDAGGTSLYRIAPDLSATLAASSRRRPAKNALDEVINGKPFGIMPSTENGAVLGSYGEGWTFLDTITGRSPERFSKRFTGSVQRASHPGIIVRCLHRGGDRNRFARVELFGPEGNELLLSHPALDATGTPRFAFPPALDEFPAREFTVAWDGKTLTVLAWTSEGSPWGISKAVLFRIDDQGSRHAPLRFAVSETDAEVIRKKRRGSPVFQYPAPKPRSLIPTDKGFVLTGSALNGFWFLPYEDLP